MCRRFCTLILAAVLFLAACSPSVVETASPSETALLPVTETSVPTIQPAPVEPATQTTTSQPAIATDWLSQLEVIGAENWSRLQLLKTFPAEMPLSQSAVAISYDGRILVVGSKEGAQIFFFDIASGQLLRTVSMGISNLGKYFNLVSMEDLPDGTLMVSSTGPYAIYHIDADGTVLSMWDGTSFALSVDKRTMAHGASEGITLVDIASNTTIGSFDGNYALDFSFSPDGSKIALNDVGVDYITTTIWNIPSRTQLSTLNEMGNARYSPDGKFLAVTSYEESTNPLIIFSPDGVTQLTSLSIDGSNGLNGKPPIFTVSGSVIAAQVANGFPVAWETTNWQLLDAAALEGELHMFSPDGRILITRTADGSILLWGVVP